MNLSLKQSNTGTRSGRGFWGGATIAGLFAAMCQSASAAIPAPAAAPVGMGSVTCGSGDYICLMGAYWKAGIAVLAIVICGVALLKVAGGLVGKYDEYRKGRAEAGDLKENVIVAVIMLACILSLTYYATTIVV